ncbi:MAG TPA: hypothetical protein ENN67_00585 [Firmicutes bacterium]|nr:hypothetical protein [Bacillota bacterium]
MQIAHAYNLRVHRVKWKDNRRVMASVGRNGDLNLHIMYQRADEDDLKSLIKVVMGRQSGLDRKRFEKFIEEHLPREYGEGPSRLVILPPKGLFHDLNAALEKVLPLLDEPLERMPLVGWSPVRVGRRGITWGTHRDTPEGPLLLVNAILDSHDVPAWVVEHIVWHELCHQAIPPVNGNNGRRLIHSRIFREFESRFPRLKDAEQWEEKNVAHLIRRHLRNRRRR